MISGLRFRKIGEHINLEARITPISFKDGKLDGATSTWIGNDKTQGSYENRRTRVSLISPNVPTKYLGKNSIDSKNNQVSTTLAIDQNWPLTNCERFLLNTYFENIKIRHLYQFDLFQFVLFGATSSQKDAAQTTIPYIDAQEVAPSSGVWFTG